MSRLQEAVDRFAADHLARTGKKPRQDLLFDGTFSRQTGEDFCLCFRNYTGIGAMVNFAGCGCAYCNKPVTDESYAWGDEAKAERAGKPPPPPRQEIRSALGFTDPEPIRRASTTQERPA